jgi:hypothetical protein
LASSKRFKNKPCVYCGDVGSTGDHIFAREFFPVGDRANLPQVPACASCNGLKSALEHYVLSVLPFGGNHPASSAILRDIIPRRLSNNHKLHLQLAEGHRDVLVNDKGVLRPSITVPIETEKLVSLTASIARGLVAYHWKTIIPPDYFVEAGYLHPEGARLFEQMMMRRSRAEIRGDLGNGLVLYQGVQAIDDENLTLWRFRLYGGVPIGGDPEHPEIVVSSLFASTSRMRVGAFSA